MKFTKKQKQLLAEIGLLFCGVTWGASFVVTKGVMEVVAPSWTAAIRSMVPALLMAPFLTGRFRKAGFHTIWVAAVSGIIQFFGLITQMIGLTMTTAGNSAFITALYVVLVPFCMWVYNKKRPGLPVFIAGVICLTGVGVIALQTNLTINRGDLFVVAAAILFAINIALISICITGGTDAMVFCCVQFFFTALPAFVMGLIMDPLPQFQVLIRNEMLWGFFYIVAINTIFAQIVHNVALGHANPSHAALIMSTEALFGALFGAIFLHEKITLRFFVGALLISVSIVLSELAKHPRRQQLLVQDDGG